MPFHMPSSRRCLSGLVGAAIASASLLAAVPAHAATMGGSISRDEVIQRAQSWVTEGVPYNQGAYYSDSNGSYREDCSGYVSMAWDLSSSMVTQTLPSVSTQIDSSQLQPGDALDYTAEHVILFGGWVDQSAGTFTYYAENNPSQLTNSYQGNLDASSLDGWPTSDYTPLRYDNITGTASATTAPTSSSSSASSTTGSSTDSGSSSTGSDSGTDTDSGASSQTSTSTGASAGTWSGGSDTQAADAARWAWTNASYTQAQRPSHSTQWHWAPYYWGSAHNG
jgi:hypothetical protein